MIITFTIKGSFNKYIYLFHVYICVGKHAITLVEVRGQLFIKVGSLLSPWGPLGLNSCQQLGGKLCHWLSHILCKGSNWCENWRLFLVLVLAFLAMSGGSSQYKLPKKEIFMRKCTTNLDSLTPGTGWATDRILGWLHVPPTPMQLLMSEPPVWWYSAGFEWPWQQKVQDQGLSGLSFCSWACK